MFNELKKIPKLGVGIGLRTEILRETFEHSDVIDCVEVIAEKYFSDRMTPFSERTLERGLEHFSIIPHGIKLSIGSIAPPEDAFLTEMRLLLDRIGTPYYSDHFTLAHNRGMLDTNHLTPIWYTKEMLQHIVAQVDRIQNAIGRPLVLENITAPFILGEADFKEPDFINEVCRRTGCGLLLDITNIHINAYNRSVDGLELLKQYPMEAVVQLHLAGGLIDRNGYFHDTHSRELNGPNEGVWRLLEWVVNHAPLKAVIIERDSDFGSNFKEAILNDLLRARAIVGNDQVSLKMNSAVPTPV